MQRIVVSLLALFFSTAPVALEELSQEAALKWLQKMGEALHQLNYDGVFVYQHGEQLSTMRLVHGRNEQGEHERLVSLSGAAREVIRSNDKVTCILPDSRSVIVERKDQSRPGFPHLLPTQVQQISDSYRFELGRRARVSGLQAQQILILPRDHYRYSYHLWIHIDSGMLLKAELRNKQHTIEQFMFTTLQFMPNFPQELLAPDVNKSEFLSYHYQRRDNVEPVNVEKNNWQVDFLPAGFILKHHQYQFQSRPQNVGMTSTSSSEPVHHLVYSDGLSTVSVFIEKLQAAQSPMNGASPLGAVNAYASMIGQTQITVVGEVPEETVREIAKSVRYQP
ncbi:MAG: MucB/RseB C-terminal domain-containing protein [Gammaproteobacteria bacterium]|nr:MucB/RseB C-terminal domain-containing protein [Gammaproteobacteria bacterium]